MMRQDLQRTHVDHMTRIAAQEQQAQAAHETWKRNFDARLKARTSSVPPDVRLMQDEVRAFGKPMRQQTADWLDGQTGKAPMHVPLDVLMGIIGAPGGNQS
jgi:hypothetical protein